MVVTIAVNNKMLARIANREDSDQQGSKIAQEGLYLRLPQAAGTGLRSAVGNGSGYRCMSDCRSRGCEFDPGPVPYFRGE